MVLLVFLFQKIILNRLLDQMEQERQPSLILLSGQLMPTKGQILF